MRHECYFCHNRTLEKLIDKFKPEAAVAEALIFSVQAMIAENREMTNPKLATDIHRMARRYLGSTDLYVEEKVTANEMLLEKYEEWKDYINRSDAPFYTAAKLSVIGNIIDYGAHSVSDDLLGQIEALSRKALTIDMTAALKDEIDRAERVLYLGDNCGEIIFDRLFIEAMGHPNVTFAVRGAPVINDATLADAHGAGMEKTCRIISNGTDAPSTILEWCSDEFMDAFNHADVIISKGQGNFEGLVGETSYNIFFLLIAKCHPIAELLGVDVGDMVITDYSRITC